MNIPTLSMSAAAQRPEEAARSLRAAFEEFGFVGIRDHGICAAEVAEAYAQVQAFFSLPPQVKRCYEVAGGAGQRGYTPFGREQGKDAQVPDLKEFWHVGRQTPPAGARPEHYPPNLWPEELPQFRPVLLSLYDRLEQLGLRVLELVARGLDLPADFFESRVQSGNSILRPLHYPPVPAATGAVRAAEHEDINVLTLLVGSDEPGLQIRTRSDEWIPVTSLPGTLVCNVGDMLQRLTNRVLRSTTHRVVNPPAPWCERSRYSMPFFLHFRPEVRLEALPGGPPERPPEPAITAQEFLEQRLRELGLMA